MTEYRYHRMTMNENGWRFPHSGRLGESNDYVGANGFGLEDWNFSGDVWEDGKAHLYLGSLPAAADKDSVFNIVLGVHTALGKMVVGFAEGVTYGTSTLDEKIWQRRAEDIERVGNEGGLAGDIEGLSSDSIIAKLKALTSYEVTVDPNDLIVLDQPVLIPNKIYKSKNDRFMLLHMGSEEYDKIRKLTQGSAKTSSDKEEDFPEGALIERLHIFRERDRSLVNEAKKKFIKKHGSLRCEVCGWEPVDKTGIPDLENKIIEAHHDVPLSSEEYSGKTKLKDLRMLCPNCHRAIHSIRPWKTVDKFLEEMEKHK